MKYLYSLISYIRLADKAPHLLSNSRQSASPFMVKRNNTVMQQNPDGKSLTNPQNNFKLAPLNSHHAIFRWLYTTWITARGYKKKQGETAESKTTKHRFPQTFQENHNWGGGSWVTFTSRQETQFEHHHQRPILETCRNHDRQKGRTICTPMACRVEAKENEEHRKFRNRRC